MVTVIANTAIDFRLIDVSLLLGGVPTIHTPTTFRVTYDAANYDEFTGTGFVYDIDFIPIGGTLTGIRGVSGGVTAYTVTNLSMPATQFIDFVFNNPAGALPAIFSGNDSLRGSNGDDYLIGYDGNDTINGGLGVDTMEGGAGNDLYIADQFDDTFVEFDGGGIDTVQSSSDALLDANVENLVLTGSAAISGEGNELGNSITGNAGSNAIFGAEGDDTLLGGSGNDTLDGWTENDSVDGGVGNDLLFGFDGDDTLFGGVGNDTLLGEAGTDTLNGGTGKDLYVFDPFGGGTDWVNAGDKGIDTVFLDGPLFDWDFNRVGDDLYIFAYVDEFDTYDETRTIRIVDHYAGANIAYFEGDFGFYNNLFYGGDPDLTRMYTPAGLTGKNQGANAELVVGTDADDKIVGNGGQTDWLFGMGGDDTITGASKSGESAWLYGDFGNDSLLGGAGNDNLRAGAGDDTINGGAENPDSEVLFLGDRADFRSSADGISVDLTKQGAPQFISADQGTDTLIEIENVRGSEFDDVITGDNNRNWLSGRLGDDSLAGNDGADVLEGWDGKDTLVGGEGDDELYGAEGDDLVQGGSGFDFMEGWAGNDTLDGGPLEGEDEITYGFDPDRIIANLGAAPLVVGSETVAGGTVRDGFGDTDTLINITGVRGSAFGDVMLGNDDYNYFEGGEGNDTMEGGGGSDGLDFFTSSQGVTVDLNKQGQVQVFASSLGSDSISGFEEAYGSFYDDILIGDGKDNFLIGQAGNDTLTGNAGDDTVRGGFGADSLDGGADIDLLDFRWAAVGVTVDLNKQGTTQIVGKGEGPDIFTGFEDVRGSAFNDKLTGDGVANALFGLTGNDTLGGNAGNDTIDGGEGADAMTGGANDDTYQVDNLKDRVTEAANAGLDLVQSTVTHVLSANVENLELLGDGNSNGTGNASKNDLIGNAGGNVLDGKGDADTMSGGAGNDTYVLDVLGDLVVEANDDGIDTVKTSVAIGKIDNVENYIFTGSKGVDFTGSGVDNLIVGTAKDDTLVGGLGNDTLNGLGGADSLKGDGGNDVYGVDNIKDKIEDSGGDKDRVESSITFSLAALGAIENLTLTGTGAINGTGNDSANIIIGNAAANKLDGGKQVDTMIGGAGNDTYMVDDKTETVTELDKGGTDLVISTADFTLGAQVENLTLLDNAVVGVGNELANSLAGNDKGNQLDGKGGADKMAGGKGDDIYVVDSLTDKVTETLTLVALGGTDTVNSSVSFTLGTYLENLTLIDGAGSINGTGNGDKNILMGNDGDNKLAGLAGNDTITGGAGNDLLDGGTGDDSLAGGEDDDVYVQDSANDKISESGTTSGDELRTNQSTLTGALAEIEHYTFTGTKAVSFTGSAAGNRITATAAADSLDGGAGNDTLNGLGGNDTLVGGLGDDTLIGGAGMDQLDGGAENDSYGIDNVKDVIIDTGGTDTVLSSIAYTLVSTLENLTLTGKGAISGTGNGGVNVIVGNDGANALSGGAGNDTIDGGLGADKMTGDAGSDTFLRHSLAEGKDTITDFDTGVGGDVLDISDMLIGFNTGEQNDFVQLVTSKTSTTIKVDVDGTDNGAKFVDVAVLGGVTTADLTSLLADGNLVMSA